ncbi:hypothetical protein ACWDRR_41120 [Kitasatospora sp. NPDC003701]
MSKHRSTRTTSSTARRALAGCTIAGAALFATVSGGQAWADGVRPAAPTAPSADNPDQPAVAAPAGAKAAPTTTATPSAKPADPKAPQAAPAVATPSAKPADPKAPQVAQPAPAAAGATPTATPSSGVQPGQAPQVKTVPQGAAQAGDGSGALDDAGTKLVGGSAAAAVGAGALGFTLLRRRSGARG